MKVSVILCTYNRCSSLARTLKSVAASEVPDSIDWEVLIVDNNSRDDTRRVAEEYCQNCAGRFRYLFEAQQGLSYARNAGIQGALGDVLAFIDDDITVAPTWLHGLTESLHDEQWAGVGGRVCLEQNFSPPPWMFLEGPYSMSGPVAAFFDLGDQPRELTRPPFGANMIFRRTMFEKYGGFRTDLGRCGESLIGGEDTEFGERLMAAGERLWYAPSAVVYHPVPTERLTKGYLLKYWFGNGQTAVRQRGNRSGPWGIPRYYLSMGMLALTAVRWMATLNTPRRFFWKCWTWMYAGKLVENYRQSRLAKQDNTATLVNS